MMDILQVALAGLPGLLPRRTIKYYRGVDYVTVNSTVARTTVDYEDDRGVRMTSEIRDYLIKVGDLEIGGVSLKPEERDKIVDENEGTMMTYMVMGIDAGIPWRYTDRYHTMFRIHTREVDEDE